MRAVEMHVIRDEQVKIAIPIVIEKAGSCSPSVEMSGNTGLSGDIGESAVAIVVIQDIAPPITNKEVVKAVVSIIAHTARLPPARAQQARLLGDVSKRTVV